MEIEGECIEELYVNSMHALVDVMVEGHENLLIKEERRIKIESDSPEELFMDWLRELLYLLSVEGFVPLKVKELEIVEKKLKAIVEGEKIDFNKARIVKEIKTPTYHMFTLKKNKNWYARVIFDV